LLELLIFLEQGNDVFQAWMERIGGGDFVRDSFGTAIGDLGLAGFLQLPAIARGDVADRGLVGQGRKQALAEDVVDLVGGEIYWRDVAFLSTQLGACVFERAVDQPGAGVVGGSKVRDNDTDVSLLASGRDKVGKGAGGNVGDGAVPHFLRVEVVEIRWHLVEQNEDGRVLSKSFNQSFSSGALGPLVQKVFNCSPLPSWLAISPQKKWSGLLRPLKAAMSATPKAWA
jgi:hypothetical protein